MLKLLLLTVHVVAGILFVGPVAVAASLFPRHVVVAQPKGGSARTERSPEIARLLHRITAGYGILALAVPVFGLALAMVQERFTELWVIVAMALTAVAGALLALQITPRQREALAAPADNAQLRRLAMMTGVFNLLWVIVVALMIVRPGSNYQ